MKRKLNILGDGPVHPPYQQAFDRIIDTFGLELWEAMPESDKDLVFRKAAEIVYHGGMYDVTEQSMANIRDELLERWNQDEG